MFGRINAGVVDQHVGLVTLRAAPVLQEEGGEVEHIPRLAQRDRLVQDDDRHK